MTSLDLFNRTLNELRLFFHKYGKLSDANAKLDEIAKLIALELHALKVSNGHSTVPIMLREYREKGVNIVNSLQESFQKAAADEMFFTSNGTPVFGQNPKLDLDEDDNDFAASIVGLIHESIKQIKDQRESFDLINEAFGHFVRDNFRNNIEDAQYMTPQEVVDLMVSMATERIAKGILKLREGFTVCDPCCGVGSLMTSFYKAFTQHKDFRKQSVKMLAQDKVQRMIRFTSLNFNLFDTGSFSITSGNSLIGPSNLDDYHNAVDLILTNPPFGAFFSKADLKGEGALKYPLLHDLFGNNTSISSEILFIDRCLGLLKEGGEILAVVPDSVISSKGIPATLRARILKNKGLRLMSIIELPVVAFAQAGTRTKTCILHLKKAKPGKQEAVFIAKSNDIGFDVNTRKGATIKVQKGKNDLPDVFEYYRKFLNLKGNPHNAAVIGETPSAVKVPYNHFFSNPWTPGHYDSTMIKELDKLGNKKEVDLIRLEDIARFVTKERKKEKRQKDAKCISILHIVNGDIIDYRSLLDYTPKYPGIVCRPGDLLFSKINPRIPRAIVVPHLDFPLTCSGEFEIIQSSSEWSNAALRALLMLPLVQLQINRLTSGTSSSHNRIRTQELRKVLIPIPTKKSVKYPAFKKLLEKEAANHQLINKLVIDRFLTDKDLQILTT